MLSDIKKQVPCFWTCSIIGTGYITGIVSEMKISINTCHQPCNQHVQQVSRKPVEVEPRSLELLQVKRSSKPFRSQTMNIYNHYTTESNINTTVPDLPGNAHITTKTSGIGCALHLYGRAIVVHSAPPGTAAAEDIITAGSKGTATVDVPPTSPCMVGATGASLILAVHLQPPPLVCHSTRSDSGISQGSSPILQANMVLRRPALARVVRGGSGAGPRQDAGSTRIACAAAPRAIDSPADSCPLVCTRTLRSPPLDQGAAASTSPFRGADQGADGHDGLRGPTAARASPAEAAGIDGAHPPRSDSRSEAVPSCSERLVPASGGGQLAGPSAALVAMVAAAAAAAAGKTQAQWTVGHSGLGGDGGAVGGRMRGHGNGIAAGSDRREPLAREAATRLAAPRAPGRVGSGV